MMVSPESVVMFVTFLQAFMMTPPREIMPQKSKEGPLGLDFPRVSPVRSRESALSPSAASSMQSCALFPPALRARVYLSTSTCLWLSFLEMDCRRISTIDLVMLVKKLEGME
ncbi:hypothetical protein AFSV47Ss_0171 [African swine fever virus]|uniref:Uncharacterized protein n=1 Tax=African swine fever virus TaxID=10497 RepID=A0A6G6AHR9_ASF|nr:hypothetical protein AFSV47Ss_0171 [African swine fever virus]